MPTVLEADGLTKVYGGTRDPVPAVTDVSLSVGEGTFVAIMGASGSGKSTLLHLLAGLDMPSAGRVRIEGHDLTAMSDHKRTLFRRRRLGIVFQAYNLLPALTARENVVLPLMVDGVRPRSVQAKVDELLRTVDLTARQTHRPQALSGGEQQRVAIARALVNDPAILLADEPTGNLDSTHGQEIWRLLKALVRDHGRTVIAVTHEAQGAAHADRIIVLKDGRIVGEIAADGGFDAALVAARYAELAG
ncbi:MAG: ABC transporter ATP-binding protein [Planctomycetes bacterium]|nr:ABC transporter ATP-binding protein [Planctomycetota bacterium]